MDMIDDPLDFCPVCYSVLGQGGPQQCHHCREYISDPVRMSAPEFGEMDRTSCPCCAKAVPEPADICPECGESIADADASVPALPQRHQNYFDYQTYEDSRLFVPLPSGSEPPSIEDIIERLGLGGIQVEVLSSNPPSTIGPDESEWEFEFLASLEGVEVRKAWVADDYGTGFEVGERYNMWLIRTPADASGFDVLLRELPDDADALIADSEWTLGINGYASTDPAESFRFQVTVGRFAAGDEVPVVDETAGRILDVERVQSIVRKKAKFDDVYELFEVPGDAGTWLHTGGLPRVGGYELEMLQVPSDRLNEAKSLLRSAAPIFCQSDRPTPYRPHDLDGRTQFIWMSIRDAEDFFPGARGTSKRERSRLIFPSAVIVTETLHPEAFRAARQTWSSDSQAPQNQQPPPRRAPGQANAPRAQGSPGQGQMQRSGGGSGLAIGAALASLVLPGVGQLMVGQTAKGIVVLFSAIALMFFTCGLSILFQPVFAVDAYMLANKQAEGQRIGEWEFF
jgi:TM2 domain-containing membrane protein YozV